MSRVGLKSCSGTEKDNSVITSVKFEEPWREEDNNQLNAIHVQNVVALNGTTIQYRTGICQDISFAACKQLNSCNKDTVVNQRPEWCSDSGL